jgi:RimJ/RimL family protein N-acetyltransferase
VNLPFAPTLPIVTPRLSLRRFRTADLDPLLAFHSLAEAVRFVPFEARTRESMATALDRKICSSVLRQEGDLLEFAVSSTRDGTLVGDVLLALRSVENATLEIGYLFDPAHGHLGYATETVRALLDLAFSGIEAHRVIARIDVRNIPSRALCARVGMRQEAQLLENSWFKGEWSSEASYALLSHEWPTA